MLCTPEVEGMGSFGVHLPDQALYIARYIDRFADTFAIFCCLGPFFDRLDGFVPHED